MGGRELYPEEFYLVNSVHLLNKDILNKDNLSSNTSRMWCDSSFSSYKLPPKSFMSGS